MSSPRHNRAAPPAEPAGLAQWEVRSVDRALETGRDKLLERSRKIVEAARELLEQKGLDGLTIRAVLKKTGLSRAAFYERFAGKDDLVLAVFEQIMWRAARHYEEDVKSLADPIERLHVIVSCLVLGKKHGDEAVNTNRNPWGAAMSREHLRLAESRPHDLRAALAPFIALIAKQLAEGMQAGLVRQENPQQMASLIYNLVSTTVHTELLSAENAQPDPARQAELADRIWEFCRRAVEARG